MEIRNDYMTIDVYNYLHERYDCNYAMIDRIENLYAECMDNVIKHYLDNGNIYVFHANKCEFIISEMYDVYDLYD